MEQDIMKEQKRRQSLGHTQNWKDSAQKRSELEAVALIHGGSTVTQA